MTVKLKNGLSVPMYPKTGGGFKSRRIPSSFRAFVEFGQSDIRGNAGMRAGIDDDYSLIPHVWAWDWELGEPVPYRHPLKHQDVYPNGTNMALQFARNLDPAYDWMIIPVARGSTGFLTHWNKPNAVYNTAVSRTNAALSYGSGSTLEAALWSVGGTDATNKNSNFLNNYKTCRTNMIADIPLMTADTPWLVGPIQNPLNDAWRTTINQNIEQFAIDVEPVHFVNIYGLPVQFDNIHTTAAGLQTMGQAYYDVWSSL